MEMVVINNNKKQINISVIMLFMKYGHLLTWDSSP